ncbi:MAG: hypothetical protein NTV16_08255 [Actinobacteria bacterium]|jgi:hypothetical protein|nr:hypothetical protein [Actinomycetota bacterium]
MPGDFENNNRLKWWEKLIIAMIVILILIIIFLIFNEKIMEAIQTFKFWYNKG